MRGHTPSPPGGRHGEDADPVARVHAAFRRRVVARDLPSAAAPGAGLDAGTALELYRAQALSRALDITARDMQKAGQGFYTIGASGHEGMAPVAAALRLGDIAFLHYRDAAFQIARARQAGQGWEAIATGFLKSFACAMDDPVSGGRHKVLGARELSIPPQTSTIASHLPKAVGTAYALGLARRQPPPRPHLLEVGLFDLVEMYRPVARIVDVGRDRGRRRGARTRRPGVRVRSAVVAPTRSTPRGNPAPRPCRPDPR